MNKYNSVQNFDAPPEMLLNKNSKLKYFSFVIFSDKLLNFIISIETMFPLFSIFHDGENTQFCSEEVKFKLKK